MNQNKENFDFFNQTYIKSYNLDKAIRYQLNLLDSLDVYTRKHCENVATIVCNLCRKLHLSRGFTEYCIICAFLHDIGKLFVPSEILQKPSQLTEEEYEIMKKHTTLGYELCMKDPKLRPYYAGAYYHHECLDGTGYPQGLFKNDIPFEAQIIKVADEYEAIVNKRQYKSHIGISDALKIIIEHTKPSPNAPQNTGYSNEGKNNKKIVKKLLKVVIDDIECEISSSFDYVNYLKKQIDRYKKISIYLQKKEESSSDEKKLYYDEYIKMYLHSNESIDEFEQLYKEAVDAYNLRKSELDNLYQEIKIIKKLSV
ncbi:MAG: HD domain-containing protein [Clostridia bacterium]|nr:HD domain-containing protein [Clostridia bacterium]